MYTDAYNLLLSHRSPTDQQSPPLAKRVHQLSLDDRSRNHLGQRLLALSYPQRHDYEAYVRRTRQWVAASLPEQALLELEDLRTAPSPAGVLVLRNLPTDPQLPTTPGRGARSHDKQTHVSEALLTGVGALLGEPYALAMARQGLVHDLSSGEVDDERGGVRAPEELGLHTEHTALDHRPRWLLLTGLRTGAGQPAPIRVADVRDALPLLRKDQHRQLREPRFLTRHARFSGRDSSNYGNPCVPHAVLTGSDETPELRVALHGHLTRGMDAVSDHALTGLSQALAGVARSIRLEPGVLVAISNRLVANGRGATTPRHDGADPWLQQLHVTDSLWPMRDWQRGSRRLLKR